MVKFGMFKCKDCGDWVHCREDEFERRGDCCEACFFVKTINLSKSKYKY